jgi:hypothetical protein
VGKRLKNGAWFKKVPGTVVRSTLRAVPATVPGTFLNHAKKWPFCPQTNIQIFSAEISHLTIQWRATEKGAGGSGDVETFIWLDEGGAVLTAELVLIWCWW